MEGGIGRGIKIERKREVHEEDWDIEKLEGKHDVKEGEWNTERYMHFDYEDEGEVDH